MRFVSKVSKQGDTYFIRIPEEVTDVIKRLHKKGVIVDVEGV